MSDDDNDSDHSVLDDVSDWLGDVLDWVETYGLWIIAVLIIINVLLGAALYVNVNSEHYTTLTSTQTRTTTTISITTYTNTTEISELTSQVSSLTSVVSSMSMASSAQQNQITILKQQVSNSLVLINGTIKMGWGYSPSKITFTVFKSTWVAGVSSNFFQIYLPRDVYNVSVTYGGWQCLFNTCNSTPSHHVLVLNQNQNTSTYYLETYHA